MAECHRVAGGEEGGFRLWTAFSDAALRRRIIDILVCGVSNQRKKQERVKCKISTSSSTTTITAAPPPSTTSEPRRSHTSERLSELFKAEAENRSKVEVFEELQRVVRKLQQHEGDNAGSDRHREAAMEVRRLAKDDPEARKTLAMLGAIPPLVRMLDSSDLDLQISSLYALLNLGIGNDVNKAAIVEAEAVDKMLKLVETGSSPSVSEAIVANFLALSALDFNKPVIGSSAGTVSFLLKLFQNQTTSQARQDSLRAIFNLSIAPSNTPYLVNSGLVPVLFASLGDMDVSDRVLSVLFNIVSAPEGRRAVSRAPDAFPALVDVLNWADSPECQEKAAYILMVMAHKAYSNRAAMVEAGAMSSLLELSLLGTSLAQKRAARILECIRVDQGKQVSEGFEGGGGAVSPAALGCGPEEGEGMSEERKAVRQLVQQSLQNNMRRIVKRANLPGDFSPSDRFRALTASSTSKSLPL